MRSASPLDSGRQDHTCAQHALNEIVDIAKDSPVTFHIGAGTTGQLFDLKALKYRLAHFLIVVDLSSIISHVEVKRSAYTYLRAPTDTEDSAFAAILVTHLYADKMDRTGRKGIARRRVVLPATTRSCLSIKLVSEVQ